MSEHSEIPVGPYCYRHTGETLNHPVFGRMPKTERCPHWYVVEAGDSGRVVRGGCHFIGKEDGANDGDTFLLWDQVKECGVNIPDECDDGTTTKAQEQQAGIVPLSASSAGGDVDSSGDGNPEAATARGDEKEPPEDVRDSGADDAQ